MEKEIYIAGASSRAQTAREYIEYLYSDTKVLAYLVSPEMDDNQSIVGSVPVLRIESGLKTDIPVYIGTRGINQPKIENELREVGFEDVRPITVQLDIELRNMYVEKVYASEGRLFRKISELSVKSCNKKSSAAIYVANSIYDGKLSDLYHMVSEEKLLQVGTALTEQRIENVEFFDDTGDNISKLNQSFCELTGLYWIWKNSLEDYIGLVHYRRHFLLPDDWVIRAESNDVDAILPVPLYVAPNIADNYRFRHSVSDWDVLIEYFRNNLPAECDDVIKIFSGNLYNPCNMLIARREVLDELCEWLFPILFYVWDTIGEKSDRYQRRYPGFMAERLITYFFESRRDKYRIVYSDKNFLN